MTTIFKMAALLYRLDEDFLLRILQKAHVS